MKFTANTGIKFVPRLCKNVGCNFTTTNTCRFGFKLQLNSNFQLGGTSDFPGVKEICCMVLPAFTVT